MVCETEFINSSLRTGLQVPTYSGYVVLVNTQTQAHTNKHTLFIGYTIYLAQPAKLKATSDITLTDAILDLCRPVLVDTRTHAHTNKHYIFTGYTISSAS